MKKIVLALAAAVAVAAPLALAAAPANADVVGDTAPGVIDTVTHNADGGTWTHQFNVTYKCTSVDGHGGIEFKTDSSPTGSGDAAGVITPDASGGGTFSLSGTNGNYTYSYGGAYDTAGVWTGTTSANDSYGYAYGFGTEAPAAGGVNFGNVSGSFTGIPDCSTPTAPVIDVPGNHGQYVSGATHAGVKGKALAEIAKDAKLVGPYKALL